MTVIDDQLVLVGGWERDGPGGEYGHPSNLLAVWDCKSGTPWTYPYPEMPTPRSGCSAVVHRQWLVVAGGWANRQALCCVEVLDTRTKTWHVGPQTTEPLYCMKSAVVADMGYFMGGTDNTGSPTATVHQVNLRRLTKAISADSPHQAEAPVWKAIWGLGLIGAAPLSIGLALLVVGGVDEDSNTTATALHLYRPDADKWLKVGDLPSPRRYCTCVMITGNQVLVAGGEITRTVQIPHVDFAQIS